MKWVETVSLGNVAVDEQHPIAASRQQHRGRRPTAPRPDNDRVEHIYPLPSPRLAQLDRLSGESAPPLAGDCVN